MTNIIKKVGNMFMLAFSLICLSMSPAEQGDPKQKFLVRHDGKYLCLNYKAAEAHVLHHQVKSQCRVVGFCD